MMAKRKILHKTTVTLTNGEQFSYNVVNVVYAMEGFRGLSGDVLMQVAAADEWNEFVDANFTHISFIGYNNLRHIYPMSNVLCVCKTEE